MFVKSGSMCPSMCPDKTRGPLPAEQVWGVLEIRKLWASRRQKRGVSFCRRLSFCPQQKTRIRNPRDIRGLLKMTGILNIGLWNNPYLTWVVFHTLYNPTNPSWPVFFHGSTGETFQGKKAHSKQLVFEKKKPSNTNGASEIHECKSSAAQLRGVQIWIRSQNCGWVRIDGRSSPLPSFFSWRFVRDHRDHRKIRYMAVASFAIDLVASTFKVRTVGKVSARKTVAPSSPQHAQSKIPEQRRETILYDSPPAWPNHQPFSAAFSQKPVATV